jgi:propanol-preferring alcohol dehydrogenase
MKAMVLEHAAPIETLPLSMKEMTQPQTTEGQLRVRVSCCAVCRTDLHIVEGEVPAPRFPLVPGHQTVGVVDQLGPGATRFEVGTRVGIAWLGHACGECRFCTSGRENLCPYSRYSGYHIDGGYAEYAIVAQEFAYEIPDSFSDVEAAPLLCAGIVGYRALKRANLPAGGRLAIFGFGSSAHVVIQVAKARGCMVYVVSRALGHQQLARELGAAWAGADATQMPDKVDSAILFAPAGSLVPVALSALDRGGTLSLAGIHMTPLPELDYDRYLFNERDMHPVTANTREDGRELLHLASSIPIRPRTTTYALKDANRALLEMKQGKVDGTGVLEIG